MVKLIVCGGREYFDRDALYAFMDSIASKRKIALIIEGGASGADTLAQEWAVSRDIHCCTVPALWGSRGKAAGMDRNRAMLSLKPDGVVAFPGGAGTGGMIRIAREAGVPVMTFKEG